MRRNHLNPGFFRRTYMVHRNILSYMRQLSLGISSCFSRVDSVLKAILFGFHRQVAFRIQGGFFEVLLTGGAVHLFIDSLTAYVKGEEKCIYVMYGRRFDDQLSYIREVSRVVAP